MIKDVIEQIAKFLDFVNTAMNMIVSNAKLVINLIMVFAIKKLFLKKCFLLRL